MSAVETLFGGLPVSSLAQAMLQDALEHHESKTDDSAAASSNVVIYKNAEIRRLAQVGSMLKNIMGWHLHRCLAVLTILADL